MHRAIKGAATGLLFTAAGLAFTAVLLPPLLDQTYYDGPVSDHYDGERFFNPGDRGETKRSFLSARMARFFTGDGKAEWPERVTVTPGRPSRAGAPCPTMRGGAVIENWALCARSPPAGDAPLAPSAAAPPRSMVATWIGHATVLVQAGGVNVLTDPIWSERASPFSFVGPKRVRAPGIRLADLPRIDVIVVSHNHYDHLDVATLKALWTRDKPTIVTSLGNDALLRRAGIDAVGRDWGQSVRAKRGAIVTVERNHHWSSRWGSDRNRALWSSFTIRTPAGNIYHAGDTGFGDGRWIADAARRGPVRLAILPIGAYEPRNVMRDNHVNPAEAVRVFDALRPAMAIGMHWGTFQLTYEPIDAPRQWLARIRGGRRFVTTEVGRSVAVPEVAGGTVPPSATRQRVTNP